MSAKSGNSLATVLIVAAIVAALYFGREVLLPMALAVLLSFVLAPPVKLLQRLYLPRFAAVTIVVLLAFGVIFGLATLMFTQVSQLAGDLPRYQSNLGEKIQTLRGAATASGTLEQASQVLQNLQKELDRPKSAKPTSPTTPDASSLPDRPIPVEVRQPDPGALQTLATLIAPLIHPSRPRVSLLFSSSSSSCSSRTCAIDSSELPVRTIFSEQLWPWTMPENV
jgi:hypothetical protein